MSVKVSNKVAVPSAGEKSVPWKRHFKWTNEMPEEYGKGRLEDVRRMWESVERLIACDLWWLLCGFVMDLPKHKYRWADRPADLHLWDRKSWSHLNDFCSLGVKLDPGNLILF